MKVRLKSGEYVPEFDSRSHLTYEDLRPGDVFRYARGRQHNVYLKLPNSAFQFGANREFQDPIHSTILGGIFVIKIDAELVLGEESTTPPDRNEDEYPLDYDECDEYDDEDFFFYEDYQPF